MAVASLQVNNLRAFKPQQHHLINSIPKRLSTISCSAATPTKGYTITLLPGDGIGPEVISVAKNVLQLAASFDGTLKPKNFIHLSKNILLYCCFSKLLNCIGLYFF